MFVELKHVLERVHLESSELEGVKIEHNQKLDQLLKSQETLLQVSSVKGLFSFFDMQNYDMHITMWVYVTQVRVELQRVHEQLQEQNGEAERQRTLLEKEREELHALQQKNLDLQGQTDTAVKERSSLQEQCKNLEARRMHAQR